MFTVQLFFVGHAAWWLKYLVSVRWLFKVCVSLCESADDLVVYSRVVCVHNNKIYTIPLSLDSLYRLCDFTTPSVLSKHACTFART